MSPDHWFVQLHLHSPHLIKALLAGTLVSTVCGVVGCFIVLRRTAFLADAVAHAMLAGVVSGYLFMKFVFGIEAHAPAMLLGSFVAGLFTVGMVSLVARCSRIKEDAVIGIMYTAIFAAGGVLLSRFDEHVHVDLAHFLTGELLAVRDADLWLMAGVSSAVLSIVILLFRHLQLVSFDRVMAASLGLPVLLLDYLLTACTSLVVVSGVNIVGVILVVGLLIIPAATAYLLCDRLSRMVWVAALLGWTGFLLGYGFAEWASVAPGSAVVLASAVQFLVVLAIAPRYGLLADYLRRRRAIPQQLVEDVLGSILRSPGEVTTRQEIVTHVDAGGEAVQAALRSLARRELIAVENQTISLTEDGLREAQRLVRAHRLWESYLEHIGAPPEALHDQAHVLEHVNDPAALEYLDDKLGHPLTDPHGAEIPEDTSAVAGAEVRAAVLREGRRAVITAIPPQLASRTGLARGAAVTAGPRSADGKLWTLLTQDGRQIQLTHADADALVVQLN